MPAAKPVEQIPSHFYLRTFFSRMKPNKRERWGLRAPRPCGKGFHPLHPSRRISKPGRANKFRLLRWGIRKIEASGPRKPGKSQGESELSPGDYSLAFPGCFASGKAASPPGQKHNDVKPIFLVPTGNSGNQVVLSLFVTSAIEVQEMKSPGAGFRGRGGPCSVILHKKAVNSIT